VASRKASQLALEAFTAALPEMLGGSADLTGSNLTNTKSTPAFRVDLAGDVVKTADGRHRGPPRHINYGVREFGMAAIMNGVALHGGYIPYGGTFLTFSDYSRNAIRMAALMKQRVIHVFTHDSIGLGEDGPTHQSIEHAASLRLIPGLDVWRPADTAETTVAWAVALQNAHRPSALLLSRQNLAYSPKSDLGDISRGAYVLSEPEHVGMKKTHGVIIATGSEVQLAMAAQKLLAERKIGVRVVSMPSTNVFDRQTPTTSKACCPKACPAWRWRWAAPTAGGNTAAPPWSASTPMANRLPRLCCSNTLASPPKTWPTRSTLRCSRPDKARRTPSDRAEARGSGSCKGLGFQSGYVTV
jgi:transketolase